MPDSSPQAQALQVEKALLLELDKLEAARRMQPHGTLTRDELQSLGVACGGASRYAQGAQHGAGQETDREIQQEKVKVGNQERDEGDGVDGPIGEASRANGRRPLRQLATAIVKIPAVVAYLSQLVGDLGLFHAPTGSSLSSSQRGHANTTHSGGKLLIFGHHRVMLDAIEASLGQVAGKEAADREEDGKDRGRDRDRDGSVGEGEGTQRGDGNGRDESDVGRVVGSRGMDSYLADRVGRPKPTQVGTAHRARDTAGGEATSNVLRHGRDYIRIDGSTPLADRVGLIRSFQTEDACQVALVSTTAGAVGVDLSAASLVIFAEMEWSAGVLLQAEDRAYRLSRHGGSKEGKRGPAAVRVRHAVEVRYLLLRGSADDSMWRSFRR